MKGFVLATDDDVQSPGDLEPWESLVTEAVGNVIGFWNFKRNHGRIWALLYLRGEAMSAPDLQDALGISKGAVSMITRELEQWGVIRRVRPAGDALWRFSAETDLLRMIGTVVREREAIMVKRVHADLQEAMRLAKQAKGPAQVRDRIAKMSGLAAMVDGALSAFILTARFDASRAKTLLSGDEKGKS